MPTATFIHVLSDLKEYEFTTSDEADSNIDEPSEFIDDFGEREPDNYDDLRVIGDVEPGDRELSPLPEKTLFQKFVDASYAGVPVLGEYL